MTEQKNAPEGRPSPEALLEVARREGGHAGRLKIFVGAAPGVGKTYEMLQTARSKVKDGADVVVGVVETHGRKETKALLRNLEILPPKQIAYKGRELQELDLDALIARRPQIALVDELAHTNAPGSRHPKRYLDVKSGAKASPSACRFSMKVSVFRLTISSASSTSSIECRRVITFVQARGSD